MQRSASSFGRCTLFVLCLASFVCLQADDAIIQSTEDSEDFEHYRPLPQVPSDGESASFIQLSETEQMICHSDETPSRPTWLLHVSGPNYSTNLFAVQMTLTNNEFRGKPNWFAQENHTKREIIIDLTVNDEIVLEKILEPGHPTIEELETGGRNQGYVLGTTAPDFLGVYHACMTIRERVDGSDPSVYTPVVCDCQVMTLGPPPNMDRPTINNVIYSAFPSLYFVEFDAHGEREPSALIQHGMRGLGKLLSFARILKRVLILKKHKPETWKNTDNYAIPDRNPNPSCKSGLDVFLPLWMYVDIDIEGIRAHGYDLLRAEDKPFDPDFDFLLDPPLDMNGRYNGAEIYGSIEMPLVETLERFQFQPDDYGDINGDGDGDGDGGDGGTGEAIEGSGSQDMAQVDKKHATTLASHPHRVLLDIPFVQSAMRRRLFSSELLLLHGYMRPSMLVRLVAETRIGNDGIEFENTIAVSFTAATSDDVEMVLLDQLKTVLSNNSDLCVVLIVLFDGSNHSDERVDEFVTHAQSVIDTLDSSRQITLGALVPPADEQPGLSFMAATHIAIESAHFIGWERSHFDWDVWYQRASRTVSASVLGPGEGAGTGEGAGGMEMIAERTVLVAVDMDGGNSDPDDVNGDKGFSAGGGACLLRQQRQTQQQEQHDVSLWATSSGAPSNYWERSDPLCFGASPSLNQLLRQRYPHQRYLAVNLTYGRFNNQRQSLVHHIAVATALNRTLILPRFHNEDEVWRFWMASTNDKFGRFFQADELTRAGYSVTDDVEDSDFSLNEIVDLSPTAVSAESYEEVGFDGAVSVQYRLLSRSMVPPGPSLKDISFFGGGYYTAEQWRTELGDITAPLLRLDNLMEAYDYEGMKANGMSERWLEEDTPLFGYPRSRLKKHVFMHPIFGVPLYENGVSAEYRSIRRSVKPVSIVVAEATAFMESEEMRANTFVAMQIRQNSAMQKDDIAGWPDAMRSCPCCCYPWSNEYYWNRTRDALHAAKVNTVFVVASTYSLADVATELASFLGKGFRVAYYLPKYHDSNFNVLVQQHIAARASISLLSLCSTLSMEIYQERVSILGYDDTNSWFW